METVKSGWLFKRSRSFFRLRKWRRRYFVVTTHYMSYYKDPQCKLKKLFSLEKIILVKQVNNAHWAFEVFFTQFKMHLRAECASDWESWMSCLQPTRRFSEIQMNTEKLAMNLEEFLEGCYNHPLHKVERVLYFAYLRELKKGFQVFCSGIVFVRTLRVLQNKQQQREAIRRIFKIHRNTETSYWHNKLKLSSE